MIKGATQIIAGIPGRYLDPFRVAESQPEGFGGYILISYETDHRTWDLLLLAGRAISGAARVDENHREPVEPADVKERFAGLRDRTRVFLFEASESKLRPFERTLHIVPSLKFQVDPLSRRQMVRLIKNVPGTRFVAERVVNQPPFPLVEFLEIRSPDQQIEFELRFRKGLLILYRMDEPNPNCQQIPLLLEEGVEKGGSLSGAGLSLVAGFWSKFLAVATPYLKKGSFDALLPDERGEVFARIPQVLKTASPFRRPRLRRAVLEVLGQLYSEKFEELKSLGLDAKVEACYREIKG